MINPEVAAQLEVSETLRDVAKGCIPPRAFKAHDAVEIGYLVDTPTPAELETDNDDKVELKFTYYPYEKIISIRSREILLTQELGPKETRLFVLCKSIDVHAETGALSDYSERGEVLDNGVFVEPISEAVLDGLVLNTEPWDAPEDTLEELKAARKDIKDRLTPGNQNYFLALLASI